MNGTAYRFTPRLELLDGRVVPSTLTVWGVDAGGGAVHRGAESTIPLRSRGSTEEIPQGWPAVALRTVEPPPPIGEEIPTYSSAGLTINRNTGEEITIRPL